MSYFGAAGGVLVAAAPASGALAGGVLVLELSPQPVNIAPVTSPISTNKVIVRFIEAFTIREMGGSDKENLLLSLRRLHHQNLNLNPCWAIELQRFKTKS